VASKRRPSAAAAPWRHEKAGSPTRRLKRKTHPHSLMNAEQIIAAHAKRLGLPPEQLREALLFHAAGDLLVWADEQEKLDPGSVWYSGDVPPWLEPCLETLSRGFF